MSEHHHYDHRDAACEDCMAREARIAELEANIAKIEDAYDVVSAEDNRRIAQLEALLREAREDVMDPVIEAAIDAALDPTETPEPPDDAPCGLVSPDLNDSDAVAKFLHDLHEERYS